MNEKKVREALENARKFLRLDSKTVQLLEQAIAPTPRFYVGQPVLVETINLRTEKGILREIRDGFYCTENGAYSHCKPDPDAVSLPNWITPGPHVCSIECPENSYISWLNKNEDVHVLDKNQPLTGLTDVVQYCIIPLPEFLS